MIYDIMIFTSRLALPEHYVCFPWHAHRTNVKARWGLFSLKFDVICHNNVCEESLNLIDCEEATRADRESMSDCKG